MRTFADKVIAFNKQLEFKGTLPAGISIINPFKENKIAIGTAKSFYKKFYRDNNPRHIILGINPGRFGAAITGVPFTDSHRLIKDCGINFEGDPTRELSSVFIYEMIAAFGGPEKFYQQFYINSVCPLGFTSNKKNGKELNYNYYDSPELTTAVYEFIIDSINKQMKFGIETDICFCFGTGKNEKFLRKLNDEHLFFKKIIALEHPRFIMQYKLKSKEIYIDKYLKAFSPLSR